MANERFQVACTLTSRQSHTHRAERTDTTGKVLYVRSVVTWSVSKQSKNAGKFRGSKTYLLGCNYDWKMKLRRYFSFRQALHLANISTNGCLRRWKREKERKKTEKGVSLSVPNQTQHWTRIGLPFSFFAYLSNQSCLSCSSAKQSCSSRLSSWISLFSFVVVCSRFAGIVGKSIPGLGQWTPFLGQELFFMFFLLFLFFAFRLWLLLKLNAWGLRWPSQSSPLSFALTLAFKWALRRLFNLTIGFLSLSNVKLWPRLQSIHLSASVAIKFCCRVFEEDTTTSRFFGCSFHAHERTLRCNSLINSIESTPQVRTWWRRSRLSHRQSVARFILDWNRLRSSTCETKNCFGKEKTWGGSVNGKEDDRKPRTTRVHFPLLPSSALSLGFGARFAYLRLNRMDIIFQKRMDRWTLSSGFAFANLELRSKSAVTFGMPLRLPKDSTSKTPIRRSNNLINFELVPMNGLHWYWDRQGKLQFKVEVEARRYADKGNQPNWTRKAAPIPRVNPNHHGSRWAREESFRVATDRRVLFPFKLEGFLYQSF